MGQLMHSWVLSLFLPRCWCALRPTITFEVVAGPRVTFIAGHSRVLHLLWAGAQSPSGMPTSLLGIYNFLPLLHVGVFRILHTYCNCSKNMRHYNILKYYWILFDVCEGCQDISVVL